MKKYIKYNFENLEIYQLASDFAAKIYRVTNDFPKEELFGLTSQIRRAAVSTVLNIVEGSGRGSRKDFARFINQAIGSLFETKAGLLLAVKLKYFSEDAARNIFIPIDKLFFKMTAFKKYLINV